MGLDQLELALAERRQVEQLVDRDVLLDRAQDHPRRADQLVDAEVLEQLLVLGVVDPGDGPRDVEVVLGHLADDEVVLVVAGHRRDDVRAVAAGLAEVLALAAVVRDHDRADLVGDLPRAVAVLFHEGHLVAGFDELLGEVVADLAPADDEYEHGSDLLGRAGPATGGVVAAEVASLALRPAPMRDTDGIVRVVPGGVLPIGSWAS